MVTKRELMCDRPLPRPATSGTFQLVMTTSGLALAVVTGLAVAGCVHAGFTKTTAMGVPARSPDCHLEIMFNGPPMRPYVVLGPVWTDSSSPQVFYGRLDNNAAPVQRLIRQACLAGAHGLMSVTVGAYRSWSGRSWKRTIAAAVAFVYVDASGRALPPPSGPRVDIPLSAFGQ